MIFFIYWYVINMLRAGDMLLKEIFYFYVRVPVAAEAGHFGHKTFRHQDTSAPTLSRITGGAVSCLNCPGPKVSWLFVDMMPKCLVRRFLVLKCLMRVRSVLWPKCPVTVVAHPAEMSKVAYTPLLDAVCRILVSCCRSLLLIPSFLVLSSSFTSMPFHDVRVDAFVAPRNKNK